MNTRSKKIVKYLESDYYLLRRLVRINGGNVKIAAEKLLAEMPICFNKSTEHYTIDAYVDIATDGIVPCNGWDMLGGPDPDQFVLNGLKTFSTWNNEVVKLKKLDNYDLEFYKKHKFITSVETKNIKLNVYAL